LAAELYQKTLAAENVPFLVPSDSEQDALMEVIYDGVKAGAAPKTYRAAMEGVLAALTARGADYFILGCTELPLAFQELALDATAIDPTAELAKAAIRFCGYTVKNN
jgi:aspartate racemase